MMLVSPVFGSDNYRYPYFKSLHKLITELNEKNNDLNIAWLQPKYDKNASANFCIDGFDGSLRGVVYFLNNGMTYLFDLEKKILVENDLKMHDYVGHNGFANTYLDYNNWDGEAYSSPTGDKVEIIQKDFKKHFYGRPFEYKIVNNFTWLHVKFEARPEHECIPEFKESSYSNPYKNI